MKQYFQTDLYKIKPYTPGEQPGFDKHIIKLNTNENPYPPSPKTKEAGSRILKKGLLRKYPNPISKSLVEEIASQHKISTDMVLVTNGSDEALSLLFKASLGPKSKLVIPYPTYSLYPVLSEIQMNGVQVEKIPLRPNLHIDFPALKKCKGNLLAFANPNAPTGIRETQKEISDLVTHFPGIVLCDEAYIDFAPQGSSMIPEIANFENLFVSRTFSKSYGLAGLRVGYLIGNKELISLLYSIKDSYNVGMLEQEIALAALKDQKYFQKTINIIIKSRERLAKELLQLSFQVTYSDSNFLFVRPPASISAENLYEKLKSEGIFIRYFSDDFCKNYVRISIGTEKENKALLRAIRKYI